MGKSWDDTYEELKKKFPDLAGSDWYSLASQDTDLFTDIIGDVIRTGGSKPNKRSKLSRREAQEQLSRIAGDDYSDLNFHETFAHLCRGYSVRGVANKISVSPNYTYRMMNGEATPSLEIIERIAKGFNKHPSYFLEYRIACVLMIIDKFLTANPETATAWFHRTKKPKILRVT